LEKPSGIRQHAGYSIWFCQPNSGIASDGEEAYLQVARLAPFAEDASGTVSLNGEAP
jgi:hypothetical protein